MSTTDPRAAGLPTPPAGETSLTPSPENLPAQSGAWPDPAVIARLANQFFAAMPGQALPEGTPIAPPSSANPAAASVSTPGAPDVPTALASAPLTEADLRALPATLLGPTGVPLQTPPGDYQPVPASSGAPYYFLQNDKVAPAGHQEALPTLGEAFSFPLVPSLKPVGAEPAVRLAAPHTRPVQTGSHDAPLGAADFESDLPAAVPPGAAPAKVGESPYFLDDIDLTPGFPMPPAGELFSLPGVPGLQSIPGISGSPAPPPGGSPPASVDASTPARRDSVPDLGFSARPFDPRAVRRDFPILQERIHGRELVWLDNAATTQKPNAVIDRLNYFYRHENSNVHRAAHTLAARSTDAYEGAREKVRRFLNASTTREIVFVRGATEGINLVAKSWGLRNVEKDDEIVVTWLEHHANIVPWQQLCSVTGAHLRVAPVDDTGQVILEEYEKLLNSRTRIVAFSHVSNALGTITPAREMVEIAHRHGARVLVDGAQSVAHLREDMQALDCDFFVFSGHKIFAPTGVGVVFGKADLLDHAPPWQGGGNMILDVTFEKTTYQQAPQRFEAGTGTIADAVALGAALDYLSELGIENVGRYEHELLAYATERLAIVPGLKLIGTAREKASVLSFVIDGIRTEDIGKALDQEGIAVRAGHHCAQPILRRFGVESTVRASLALYNICEDIDRLIAALLRIQAGRG